jgi:hypothetical protein
MYCHSGERSIATISVYAPITEGALLDDHVGNRLCLNLGNSRDGADLFKEFLLRRVATEESQKSIPSTNKSNDENSEC